MSGEQKDTPSCALCQKPIGGDPDDQMCHGCKSYICEECDLNPTLMGGHTPEDHQDESWIDDEEGE